MNTKLEMSHEASNNAFNNFYKEYNLLKEKVLLKVIAPKADIKVTYGKKKFVFKSNLFNLYDEENIQEFNKLFNHIISVALRYMKKGKMIPNLLAPLLEFPDLDTLTHPVLQYHIDKIHEIMKDREKNPVRNKDGIRIGVLKEKPDEEVAVEVENGNI